jgi:hypothetical protein
MITINWNPVAHLGPIPINWYGLGWVVAFLAGASLVRRWARRVDIPPETIETLLVWTLVGAFVGLKNGQWTAVAILLVSIPSLILTARRKQAPPAIA